MNPRDEAHPIHHDIAVLLTRVTICGNKTSGCSLLGVAYKGGACKANFSCAVCKDTGLDLGVTVAHEIGHLFGNSHDDGKETDFTPVADDSNIYVMSPRVKMGISTWSSCSRKSMQEFLESGRGGCLLDAPQDYSFRLP